MTHEEALLKGCEALLSPAGNPDRVEGIAPWMIDRVVDAWYKAAPLFPGDEPGCLWRDHPHPFMRKAKS